VDALKTPTPTLPRSTGRGRKRARINQDAYKNLENLAAVVTLHIVHDNFCRVHGRLRITPAMAACLTDHVWELDELLAVI
jgi:hypothetical protein